MGKVKYAVFTMDVEDFSDTECVRNFGQRAEVDLLDGFDEYIRLLDKYQIKSTLFTVGTLIPKVEDRLKSHIRNGHRLALHSYAHVAPMDVDIPRFREQTKAAKEQMSQLFDTEVEGYRAPCFSMDKERLEVLRDLGFRYDSSHLGFLKANHTVRLDLSSFRKLREGIFCSDGFYEFGLSRQKVLGAEFPISGGGYVRLSNWEFIKTLILQYIRRNSYYVFYLHPFELTKRKIPSFRELKSYDKFYLRHGISTYCRRVEWIIRMLRKFGYRFVTFEELVRIMNQEQMAQ